MARPRRPKPKESGRRTKKKVSILNTESIEYVDWKDVNLLRRFQSDRAKIRARRVTGNNTQQQRQIAVAIRNAREISLGRVYLVFKRFALAVGACTDKGAARCFTQHRMQRCRRQHHTNLVQAWMHRSHDLVRPCSQ